MLVLSRKVNDAISIADDTVVTVLYIRGNKVGIGIETHESRRILRMELDPRKERAVLQGPLKVA